ncbi:MAG: hypothetical protein LBQ79_10960 [Deltaproteobacteria bacterium]|jgi:hypothetical protein|nr:hypothetical protein [Deltaproteobacteria bacterium]
MADENNISYQCPHDAATDSPVQDGNAPGKRTKSVVVKYLAESIRLIILALVAVFAVTYLTGVPNRITGPQARPEAVGRAPAITAPDNLAAASETQAPVGSVAPGMTSSGINEDTKAYLNTFFIISGIVVAFLSVFFGFLLNRLSNDISSLSKRMDDRFIASDKRIDDKFARIDDKFAALDMKMSELLKAIFLTKADVARLEGSLYGLKPSKDKHESNVKDDLADTQDPVKDATAVA